MPILTRSWKKKPGGLRGGERETAAVDQEALKREVFRVLSRTSEDQEFRQALMEMETEALNTYKLSSEAKDRHPVGRFAMAE